MDTIGMGMGLAAIIGAVYLVHRKVKLWKRDTEDLESERQRNRRLERRRSRKLTL